MADRTRHKTYEAFGAYVRSQRELTQLSLRQAAELARISNPYLSQIEHGLALPSIAVISALADVLEVSADALLLRAAGMEAGDMTEHTATTTEAAIRHDQRLDNAQKNAMLTVLGSFVGPSSSRSQRRPVGEGATPAAAHSAKQPPPAKDPSTGQRK